MKTRICLFIGLLLLSYSIAVSKETTIGNDATQKGSINVFTSPNLYPLTMKWASEYGNLNPGMKISVIKSVHNNIADLLKTGTGIGFITDESYPALPNQSTWNMVVGRDVIVPVMNAANPFRDEIYRKGITPEGLARILANPENQNWGMLMGNTKNIPDIPMHYYIVNEPSIISGVANFMNTNLLSHIGIKVSNAQEMISAIQKDPDALGFCRLFQIIDPNNQRIAEHINLVPIDKNGNGKIDYVEAIYDNLQDFSRGVWIGKYPKALFNNIYSVASVKPKNEAELAFLNWVLTDGQQFLSANGYSDLVLSERQTQLARINEPPIYATSLSPAYSILTVILLFLFAIVAIGFIADNLVRRIRNRKGAIVNSAFTFHPVFDENSIVIPKGLYFDKTHTWAFMKKDGKVKIGIDDFLQHVTGPLTRIEMKNTGEKIKKGDYLLTIIQKGKQLNIYSPVTGTITAQNKNLITKSALINTAPFTDGWIYIVEPTNWLLEIQFLTMAEKYKTWLKEEASRLKDFFAGAVRIHAPAFAMVLQDGGVLRDGILTDLGPEVWEDFQTKFIDINR